MSASVTRFLPADLDLEPDPRRLARKAGLKYVLDSTPGFSRRRQGKGFTFLNVNGSRLSEEVHLARIQSLVLPPAWQDVWICTLSNGHLQATGRDEKGRKQYRYHDRWTRAANWLKFDRLQAFGLALPAIRQRLRQDLDSDDDRTRTLALMATLLDRTAIRVGNKEYADENEHYGLTTLLDDHVTVRGDVTRFEFVGKSGKEKVIELVDPDLTPRIKRLLGRKGARLFEVKIDRDNYCPVEADELNAYLRDMTPPGCTAKTFRTWHGTILAFEYLAAACGAPAASRRKQAAMGEPCVATAKKELEKTLRAAIKIAAELLGNTTAVCKSFYVHPALCDLFAEAALAAHLKALRPKRIAGLSAVEIRLIALLARLARLHVVAAR